ncbi:tbp associated factor [Moniliophthora roreri]|nr:tbp associated factor [Moniliophthora roreri]
MTTLSGEDPALGLPTRDFSWVFSSGATNRALAHRSDGVVGGTSAGVAERLVGPDSGSFLGGHTSIGEGGTSDFTWSMSTSPLPSRSAPSSLSRSISSATSSRNSRPRRPIASLRAFLTSAGLESTAGFTNSFPEDARSNLPCAISS